MAGAGQRADLDHSLDDIIMRRAAGGREPSGSSGSGGPSAGRGRHGGEPKGGGPEPKGRGREPKGRGKPFREKADHQQAATVLDPADGTFANWPTWLTGKLIMARRTEVIRTWIQSS